VKTLQDLLEVAAQGPAALHCVGGPSWTAAELLEQARRAAGGARAAGIQPGDRVLLLVADIPDFFRAFWGCVWAGATPVPLAGPRAASPEELGRVRRVMEILRGPVVVDRGVRMAGLDLVDVARLVDGDPIDRVEPRGPALIQFSSGSTRAPRGVVLGHEQLLANIEQLATRVPLSPSDVVLTWMPHFHDMGLIGCHILGLRQGVVEHRMGAAEAVLDPVRWLRTAADVGATALSSTNLALARLNQRAPEGIPEELDLSKVRLLAVGAEPISAAVCREFSRITGIPEAAHYPMYGLAEACVGVAAPREPGLQTLEIEGRECVVIGELLEGMEARISGAGLLEVRGPNVFGEYLGDEEATAEALDGGWLRTGDLATLTDGALTILGRAKNVVCVGGRNLHAHDIEAVAEEVAGVRPGGAVAVSDTVLGSEALSVLVRTDPAVPCAPVLWAVRDAVTRGFGVELASVLPLERVPRTTSGKKQRAELQRRLLAGEFDDVVGNTAGLVIEELSVVLGRPITDDDLDRDLRELGASSLQAVELLTRIGDRLGTDVDHRRVLRAANLRGLARGLERDPPESSSVRPSRGGGPLTITALRCRLPGADGPAELWDLVARGECVIGPSPRWERSGYVGGFLNEVEQFDAVRFRISDDEAGAMDPQQRLVLTLAADAVADAALGDDRRVGVFVGAGGQAYFEQVLDHLEDDLPAGTMAGNLLSMLAARVAHHLDLRGPALTVDTACSSGLVALHLARRSLEAGECDAAVVAAVNLNLSPTGHRLFEIAGALSPTGRCRPFEPEADGMVPGEGAVVLVLEGGDRPGIGRLLGSAINNDGASLGVMAPNPAGQDAVIRAALADAGRAPDEVVYIEAHGTGTPVGDAVEASVLARRYPHGPPRGSVKAHVGHLLAAAGLAGLVRALGELEPGAVGAVSSFGFGGTNAHILVERGTGAVAPAAPPTGGRHSIGEPSLAGWLHTVRKDPAGGLTFSPVAARPDEPIRGRVLITGASGGLGRHVARHLARSADELVLLGRRAWDDELRAWTRELRRRGGAAVSYRSLDLEDPEAIAEFVDEAAPFDAVVHLAGTVGAHAHAVKCRSLELLQGLRCGAWVLFSSIAGVLPGLSDGIESYASANAWLDRWAAAGDRPGRRVVSIAWPPWLGSGLADGLAEHYTARGIRPIEPGRAVRAMDAALASGHARVVVLNRGHSERRAVSTAVGDALRAAIAASAGRPLDEVRDDHAIAELGIDSVVALELVSDLEGVVGHALPSTLLFEHRTVGEVLAALRGGASRSPDPDSIPGDLNDPDVVPLLPAQETFLVQSRYFPDVPGNVLLACTARRGGAPGLEHEALSGALLLLARRHPTLHAQVRERSLHLDGPDPELRWVDVVDVAAIHQEPFDPLAGSLLRVVCDGTTLVLNAAHIAVDAWSLCILMQELLELHELEALGGVADLPAIETTWAQAAAALRGAADPDTAWWRTRLAGSPPLPLPWRRPTAEPVEGPFHALRFSLDPGTTEALELRAAAVGVSLPVLVLAAFACGLERWSGQHDLVIRVAQGRREARLPGLDRVVGSFADSHPVRLRLDDPDDFDRFAAQVGDALAEVQTRAGSSARALAALAERGEAPQGLGPAGFSFPRLDAPAQLGALELGDVCGASASGFTRLGLIAWQFDGRLEGTWNFAESHLDPDLVAGWSRDFVGLLGRLAAGDGPDEVLAATLHGRILARLRQDPDRIVMTGLTRGVLDRRSGALASKLPQAPRIAILARPGMDAVVAVLAVLRSGAAYVPIDPDWPPARQQQVLRTGDVAAVVAGREVEAAAAEELGLTVHRVDESERAHGPERHGETAYVMFTSGSTGEPKGVQVSHAANLAFQRWVERGLGVTESDRFVLTSSLAFGGSIRQLLTPLLCGATIHPVPPGLARDPDALVAFVRSEGITIWNSVPSLWARLMDSLERLGEADPMPSVRWVLLGGEAVPAQHVRRWWSLFGARYRLANHYGSTESVVNATWFEVRHAPSPEAVHLPIGWPRSGVDCVVDGDEDEGELLVGGSLADGYLGRPDADAAAFVLRSGHRYYRTGDRVRRLGDGALVYLGRLDSQVQVWGNRVEPKEIEHHLCAEAGVRQALVVQDPEGPLFGAYEGTADPAGLRRALAARLPAYMVPHRLERVVELPRTPAGKLDRRRLRADRAGRATANAVAAPRSDFAPTTTLDTVRRAWMEVLELDDEPAEDSNFFEQGGDSMLLLDLLDQLRDAGGRSPSPRLLYAAPSLRGMAEVLEESVGPAAISRSELTSVERGFLADTSAQPIWTAMVPLAGPVDRLALQGALAWLVQRHDALRAVFPTPTTRALSSTVDIALQYDDLGGLPDTDRARALTARWDEARALRFDLQQGPLFAVRLCRMGPSDHRLLLAAHHVVADAWSAWLLADELLAAHASMSRGETPSLPPPAGVRPTDSGAADPWWRENLAGLRQGPADAVIGGRADLHISAPRWERLVEAGRRRGVPPFGLVLAALARALAPSDDPDLVISTALAGRDDVPGARNAVGAWARAVPVRLGPDLSDGAVFRAFSAARLHSGASPLAIAAAADVRVLGRWFLTWLDPTAVLPAGTPGPLVPDWGGGRYAFDTRATGTELLISAMPLDGLHIQMTGGPVAEVLGARLDRELGDTTARAALVVYPPIGTEVPVSSPIVIERVVGGGLTSELVLLPRHDGPATTPELVDAAVRATEASAVALAGMLPTWTGLGLRPLGRDDQLVTTGHAATVAAVVLTVESVLAQLGRPWGDEDVAFVGWGSIGQAVAALARRRLGEPRRVRLVDPALSDGEQADGATLLVGASSGGCTYAVDELRPGTLVVDDSFPPIFDDAEAWARMRTERDVLILGGGSIDVGPLDRSSPFPEADAVRSRYPSRWLPGCHAEAVLLALQPELGVTRGPVTVERAARVLDAVLARGWTAAPLHLGPDEIPGSVLDALRQA